MFNKVGFIGDMVDYAIYERTYRPGVFRITKIEDVIHYQGDVYKTIGHIIPGDLEHVLNEMHVMGIIELKFIHRDTILKLI